MIETISLKKFPRDLNKIQSGLTRYLNSYKALVGEVSTPNTDLAEKIVNDLEKEITIPKSLQGQYLKALEKGAVKESMTALREMISLQQTATAINESGAVNDLLQRAYEQDNEHIEKSLLQGATKARLAFNEYGARFTELWNEYFKDFSLDNETIEKSPTHRKLFPELKDSAAIINSTSDYMQFLSNAGVIKLGSMNHWLTANNALPSNYSQPLRYPEVENKRGNGLLRLVANVAAPLSAIPKPGNEIVYQWRTQAELNQEQKEFEKMQATLKVEPGREFEALEYWAKQK